MIVDKPFYVLSSEEEARIAVVKPHIIQGDNVIVFLNRNQNPDDVLFLLQSDRNSQREERRITVKDILESSLEDSWFQSAGGSNQLFFEQEEISLLSESFKSKTFLRKNTYFCEDGDNSVHTIIYNLVIYLLS